MYSVRASGKAEMTDRSHSPKFECYAVIEEKPDAKPNPFKIGESVRLRDGTATSGTVAGILGNQVLVEWQDVSGDPQWYHQDFVLLEKRLVEGGRAPAAENKPDVRPNPFEIGEAVRLRDGTFTNGTVRGILVNEVLVAWDNVPGDPQWYNQDFILTEKRPIDQSRALQENQTEPDIVGRACRLVAKMDEDQRHRFIAYIREIYK
jgi:hypothetical protein